MIIDMTASIDQPNITIRIIDPLAFLLTSGVKALIIIFKYCFDFVTISE